jgi:hypothetical protein
LRTIINLTKINLTKIILTKIILTEGAPGKEIGSPVITASEPVYKLDELRKKEEKKSKIRGKINNMCPKVSLQKHHSKSIT